MAGKSSDAFSICKECERIDRKRRAEAKKAETAPDAKPKAIPKSAPKATPRRKRGTPKASRPLPHPRSTLKARSGGPSIVGVRPRAGVRRGRYGEVVDEPADPFDEPLPEEVIAELRRALRPEAFDSGVAFMRTFSEAKGDYEALVEQESWGKLVQAAWTVADKDDPAKVAMILIHAIGRARYAADPEGFADWLTR